MIRSLLIDDEEKAIVLLRRQLGKYCPDIEVVGESQSIKAAKELIESLQPQLIFLDIEMAGGSGFDLLESIKHRNFHVIFVTAHSEFAIRAFRFSVTDYLLKPVNRELLAQAVQRVKALLKTTASIPLSVQTLRVPIAGGVVFVQTRDIIRISADGPYTHLFLEGGKQYMTSNHLKLLEDHLDKEDFKRIHRSHLINKKKIKQVRDKQSLEIEMSDGFVIDVPRRNKAEAITILNLKSLA